MVAILKMVSTTLAVISSQHLFLRQVIVAICAVELHHVLSGHTWSQRDSAT